MLLGRTSAGSTQLPTVASPTAVASSKQSRNQALTGARTVVPEIRRQHAANCTSPLHWKSWQAWMGPWKLLHFGQGPHNRKGWEPLALAIEWAHVMSEGDTSLTHNAPQLKTHTSKSLRCERLKLRFQNNLTKSASDKFYLAGLFITLIIYLHLT